MSASQIVASFSQDVLQALTKALDTKGKELDGREHALNIREEKIKAREDYVDRLFTNHCESRRVIVQVGNTSFETTFDVLLSRPDSFFHRFQWTDGKELAKTPDNIFIARDPTSFGYVLEYLTYGELFSELSNKGLLNMLSADAKFYGLTELAQKVQDRLDSMFAVEEEYEQRLKSLEEAKIEHDKQLEEMSSKISDIREAQENHSVEIEEVEQKTTKAIKGLDGKVTALDVKCDKIQKPPLYLKAAASGTFSNGQYINWNSQIVDLTTHLQYDGSSTYTILKKCLLQLTMRYTSTCSTNGNGSANVNLMVNGTAVARCYHGQANGYQESRGMQDIREYNINDKIQFQYYSNSATVNDALGTTLTIVVLHTY